MRFKDFKIIKESSEPDIIRALRDFLPIAVAELKLERLPKIKFLSKLDNQDQPTFGTFSHDSDTYAVIELNVMNRHPVDVLRTLAHELVHYKQFVNKQLGPNSGDTGSSSENEAHVVAGIIMRHFDKLHPEYLTSKGISESITAINEAIAPHGSPADEFRHMQAGNKPAALVDPSHFKELYKKTADANNWPYFQFNIPGVNYRNFVVGLPGQERRIHRIGEIVTDMNINLQKGIKPGKEYHTELGRLLGYSDSDIKDFLKNINLDEEYKDADYARGSDKMPKAKPGRKDHPLHGKLVGE
jgi:hypothetical protein